MLQIINNPFEKKETKLLQKIYKTVLKLEEQNAKKIDVCLSFVSADEIKALNQEKRNKDEVTDVLSFPNLENVFRTPINKKTYPQEIDPNTKHIFLGDVVICLDKAKEQATEYEHSLNREVCYLFVHGLLHLLGYDHIDELDKNLMRGEEELILSKFDLTRK
jgi:probable rRNA maturation factor